MDSLREYQDRARKTAVYPDKGDNITYPALGLSGEAGEVANQVKKVLRDDNGEITPERRTAIIDELGDCLWYIANLAWEISVDLETVADLNIRKLTKRAQEDAIHGDKRKSEAEISAKYSDGRMPGAP